MSETANNNKRIAKNTILLYMRMILMMIISLYTSRVVLSTLGVTDYGLYNVIGGVVTMLSFFSGSLAGSTSRFLTYEMGKKTGGDVEHIFRVSNTIFYIFSIVTFILAETIGLWFVFTKMQIPESRITSAFWVYQSSILVFIVTLLSTTYNGLIIANEKMGAFAYISIYEAVARLVIVFLLPFLPFDRLITYAFLMLLVQISVRAIYTIYCRRNFSVCTSSWLWDASISKKVFSYTSWTLASGAASIGYTQGINILLNIFFGPAVNAARALSTQVQHAVTNLFVNFQTAIRPQIVKNYASGNVDYMHRLMINAGKFSCFLAIVSSIPLILHTDLILNLWLDEVPDYTKEFVRIALIGCCFASLAQHSIMAIHATGDIKNFQIIESICLLTILPLAYIFGRITNNPIMVVVIYVIVEGLTNLVRVHVIYPRVGLERKVFYIKVLWPILKVAVSSYLLSYILINIVKPTSMIEELASFICEVLIILICIVILGLSHAEREGIIRILKQRISKEKL